MTVTGFRLSTQHHDNIHGLNFKLSFAPDFVAHRSRKGALENYDHEFETSKAKTHLHEPELLH